MLRLHVPVLLSLSGLPSLASNPTLSDSTSGRRDQNTYYIRLNTRNGVVKISARNILKGTVKSVNHGAVNSEIVIELPGGQEIVSVITKSSAENLGLEAGKEVCAVVKASNVMLAVDE
jgi:molybdopterin-binding protein